MKTKFSSYREIDRELEILRLEREIHMHKIGKAANNFKNAITPRNIASLAFGSFSRRSAGNTGIKTLILSSVLKFALNRIFKKKRR